MKSIVIKESNRERIRAAIDEAEKRAKVRTISESYVFWAVERVEEIIGLPARKLTGTTVWVDVFANTFPGAYKGIPESTQFKIEASAGNWKLEKVCRARCHGRTQGIRIEMSEEAKQNLLEKMNGYHEW